METILQRIEKIALNEGIKITSFEKKIGASKGVLSRAINNGTDIQSKWLQSIVDNFPQYSAAWLLTGEGDMLKGENVYDDIVRIPMVDISVAAGAGYCNKDYVEELEMTSLPRSMVSHGHSFICVRVKGHSMAPSILDGGYLIIHKLERSEWMNIRDGYVYVVSDNEGRAFVKRLKNRLRENGFVVCMSDNADKQNYPNFNLMEEELNTIWYAEWYFSAKIPNIQDSYYHKQAELEDRFDDLSAQVRHLTSLIKYK